MLWQKDWMPIIATLRDLDCRKLNIICKILLVQLLHKGIVCPVMLVCNLRSFVFCCQVLPSIIINVILNVASLFQFQFPICQRCPTNYDHWITGVGSVLAACTLKNSSCLGRAQIMFEDFSDCFYTILSLLPRNASEDVIVSVRPGK